MTWEDILKEDVKKGRVSDLIKKIRDASFKRRVRKFLKQNLKVDYSFDEKESDVDFSYYDRTTDREESLKQAKDIFIQILTEAWDSEFPERKQEYVGPLDAP